MQVTQKVPMLANGILQGIPTTLDVKGLELNISLAGRDLTSLLKCMSIVTPHSRESGVVGQYMLSHNPAGLSGLVRTETHVLAIFVDTSRPGLQGMGPDWNPGRDCEECPCKQP